MCGPSFNKVIHPSPKDALCYVWLKLAYWFWKKWFLSFGSVFSLFLYYIPLEKAGALHSKMICAKTGWNWPSGSGEEDENVKSVRQQQQRRGTTDIFWSEKLTWAFGSGELKGKMCHIAHLIEKPVQIIKHVFAKLWLYNNVEGKPIISFFEN